MQGKNKIQFIISFTLLLLTNLTLAETKFYYVHTDHLGTPTVMTDQNQAVVWKAETTPFGETEVNEDPDGDGETVSLNIRFPGQYYDEETGLHYNYQRYYDPKTGRYITSDPIGIAGGINTYGYALQNPIIFGDPTGEAAIALPLIPITQIAIDSLTLTLAGGILYNELHTSDSVKAEAETTTEKCCTEYQLVYEPNPKHGSRGRWDGNRWVSPEPIHGPAVLATSVKVNPRRRVGYDPAIGQIIEFRLTRRDDVNCIEYWHGFVVSNQPVPINPAVRKAAKGAGFPVDK